MTAIAAVALPTHRAEPTDDELISLRQAVRVLAAHPLHLVVPAPLDVSAYTEAFPSLIVTRVPEHFFGSIAAHNRMLMSPHFYELFADHRFVLVHHLDAFAFRDELAEWCDRGYDYVGPPWFEGFDDAAADAPLIGVGNGGFSLRNVSTFLHVTRLLDRAETGSRVNRLPFKVRMALRKTVLPARPWARLPRARYERVFASICARFPANEDIFWGLRAPGRPARVPRHRRRGGDQLRLREPSRPALRDDGRTAAVRLSRLAQVPTRLLAPPARRGRVGGVRVRTADVTEDGAPATASSRRTAVLGTFGTMAALVTAQASVAIALLVLARRTEQAPFGSYIALYAASLSVGALLDFGSSQLRTRELARGHGRTQFRWWLRRRSTIQLPAVALFGLLALVLIGDDLPALCILGLVAQSLTYNLAQGSMAAVRSTRSPVLAEWLFAVGNVVLLAACVVAPSTWLLSAAGLAAAGTWLATAAVGLWATRHLVGGRRPSRAVNPWAGAVSFGVSSFSTSILGFSIAAITWTSGNAAAAEIGAVNKWGQPIVLFAAAYASFMFPAFASRAVGSTSRPPAAAAAADRRPRCARRVGGDRHEHVVGRPPPPARVRRLRHPPAPARARRRPRAGRPAPGLDAAGARRRRFRRPPVRRRQPERLHRNRPQLVRPRGDEHPDLLAARIERDPRSRCGAGRCSSSQRRAAPAGALT